MSKWQRLAAWLFGGLAVFVVDGSHAAPPEGCTFINVRELSFGTYATRDLEPLDTAGTVMYRCPGVSQVRMELSRGNSGSFRRSMRVRDSVMQYNIYLDAGRSVIWGDGSSGTNVYVGRPSSNGAQRVTVFGRIPPRQNVRSGVYEDQLVLTILY